MLIASSRLGRIGLYLLSSVILVGISVFEASLMGYFSPVPRCNAGEDARTCQRILFIGNSYTYVNDLPRVFADLAVSGGHRVETGMLATGGATLNDHVNDPATGQTLGSAPWAIVLKQHPSIALWQGDGTHPSQAGTYLAACVFYATIFRQSPVGLGDRGGLSDQDARDLQSAAGSAVLDLAGEWRLR